MSMIASLVIALALVLLFAAWMASFFDRAVRLTPIWRRVVAWVALLALTVSLAELLWSSSLPLSHSPAVMLPFFQSGLVFAAVAFLTYWFGTRKTLACLLPSTILVGLSWFLGLVAIA